MEEAHGKIVNFAGMLGERRGLRGLAAALALAIALGCGVALAPPSSGKNTNFGLTRMHARYGEESLGEDLIFRRC